MAIKLTISNQDVTVFIDGIMHKNAVTIDKDDIEYIKLLCQEFTTSKIIDRLKEIKQEIIYILKPSLKQKHNEAIQLEADIKTEEKKEEAKIILAENYPTVFTVIENNVFLKGFESVVMPENLVHKIIQCIDQKEPVESFVNFWKLALLNPNPEARKGLFKYIQKQNLIITKMGYFVCYRKANKTEEDGKVKKNDELQKYCTKEMIRLRQAKSSLSRYTIGELDGEFFTLDHRTVRYTEFKGKKLGLISDLILKFQESKAEVFTDNRTKTMRFSLGDVVKIDRKQCDENPNVECSSGLHVGTPTYIKGNEWAGQVYMMVFVNPMHVVSVPYADAYKMRVCEYYISAILNSLSDIHSIDASKITVFEDEYCDYELSKFDEYLKEKKFDFEEYKSLDDNRKLEFQTKLNELRKDIRVSADFISPDLSIEEIQRVIKSRIN